MYRFKHATPIFWLSRICTTEERSLRGSLRYRSFYLDILESRFHFLVCNQGFIEGLLYKEKFMSGRFSRLIFGFQLWWTPIMPIQLHFYICWCKWNRRWMKFEILFCLLEIMPQTLPQMNMMSVSVNFPEAFSAKLPPHFFSLLTWSTTHKEWFR